jgi:hypothetical protein
VATVPLGPVSASSLLWRTRGRLHVTAVVKATFEMVPDGVMTLLGAEAVDPAAGELAPYLGQTDVVARSGHVYAVPPRRLSALSLRLAVVRDWPVIDKKLLVYPRGQVGSARSQVVVERLSLRETDADAGLLVNPTNPSRPARVTALGAGSRERLAILGGRAVPRVRGHIVEIEDMFPWSYYQTAPPDQRTDHLRGDEWVVLEGLHPQRARWSSRLPGAKAQVMVYPPTLNPAAAHPVAMVADMLIVDPDRGRCSVTWRGSFPVRDEASARAVALVAGVALPGRGVFWPDQAALASSPILRAHGLVQPVEGEDEDSLAETLVPDRVDRAALDGLAQQALEGGAVSGARPGGDDAPRSVRFPRGSLELTADGVIGLIELTDEDIIAIEPDEIADPETVALSKEESAQMRSALGLPVTGRTMLRPARLNGLPWMAARDGEPDEALEPASHAEASASDDDAPELEAYTIDALELTLSESLADHGFSSIEELQALADERSSSTEPSAK